MAGGREGEPKGAGERKVRVNIGGVDGAKKVGLVQLVVC
jgi:hypothetical protein